MIKQSNYNNNLEKYLMILIIKIKYKNKSMNSYMRSKYLTKIIKIKKKKEMNQYIKYQI